jgi:predicted phage terminase large subunit-like protein
MDRAEYLRSLAELDPFTRAQLLRGDWFARPPGTKFRREWFAVVDAAPAGERLVRFWDLAATEPRPGADPDYTVGALVGLRDGAYTIRDMRRLRASPRGVEAAIAQTAALDGRAVPIVIEQEPGSSGVNTIDHYQRRVLVGYACSGSRTTGSKEVRANPVSSAAEAGNVQLLRGPWIGAFLDEAEAFPGGAHDDQVDAVSGAVARLAAGRPFVGAVGGHRTTPEELLAQQRRGALPARY